MTGHDLAMVDLQDWVMSAERNELCFMDGFHEVHQLMDANQDITTTAFDHMRERFRKYHAQMLVMVDLIQDINDCLVGDVHYSHCPGFRLVSPSNLPGLSCHPEADADLANEIKDELILGDSSSEEESSEEEEPYVPGSPISIQSQPYVPRSPEDVELGLLVPFDLDVPTVVTSPESVRDTGGRGGLTWQVH